MLARRPVRLTPPEQPPTSSQSRVKSFRFRSYVCDAIPALVTPLDSALTKRDACKSFRIRSYEKCRVSLTPNSHFGTPGSPLVTRHSPHVYSELRRATSSLISFVCHSYENCRGVGGFFPIWNTSLAGVFSLAESPTTDHEPAPSFEGAQITNHPISFFDFPHGGANNLLGR